MNRLLRTACVVALLVEITAIAYAQNFGSSGTSAFGRGFGSSGFGSSGFGSSGFGGSGFGSSGFGSSGFGSSGFGSGGFGAGGFGSSGFGSSSFGSGGFGNSGFGGSTFGNQGMGGYGGGQSFVGRDSGDMAAVWNQMGQAGTQFFNQMNRNMNRTNRNEQPAPTAESQPQPMLVNLQVAFDVPRPAPIVVATNLRTRLASILASHGIAQPVVTMEGDVAVLTGVAASDSQRLVLEKLVALEPGVSGVRNEMTVSAPAAPQALPEARN